MAKTRFGTASKNQGVRLDVRVGKYVLACATAVGKILYILLGE
jgi:DNA-binding IclR family transcriptional regulator